MDGARAHSRGPRLTPGQIRPVYYTDVYVIIHGGGGAARRFTLGLCRDARPTTVWIFRDAERDAPFKNRLLKDKINEQEP